MLYHGSKHQIANLITPHVSFDGIPLVYATDDFCYALIRAGNFNPDNFMLKEDYSGIDKPIRLIELYPGAFLDAFNCPGYVYEVEPDTFTLNAQNEYISTQPVKIKCRDTIINIWNIIKDLDTQYELIYYEDSEPYWQTVRGGKAGYLKRREERASALKEAQLKMKKKKFHFNELVEDFKKAVCKICKTCKPVFQDQMSRIQLLCLMYFLIGIILIIITENPKIIPVWGILLIPLIDIIVTTFFKYYH